MSRSILSDRIYQIMDLEGEAALNEASRKLVSTIMLVNGVLTYILEFDYERGTIVGCNYNQYCNDINTTIPVKTLDVFLPDTGLYLTKESGWLYVEKVPLRQWAKSCIGDGYKVIPLTEDVRISWRALLDLVSIERKDIIITLKKDVFYHDKKIGTFTGNQIICNNSLFQQELRDWIRDGY